MRTLLTYGVVAAVLADLSARQGLDSRVTISLAVASALFGLLLATHVTRFVFLVVRAAADTAVEAPELVGPSIPRREFLGRTVVASLAGLTAATPGLGPMPAAAQTGGCHYQSQNKKCVGDCPKAFNSSEQHNPVQLNCFEPIGSQMCICGTGAQCMNQRTGKCDDSLCPDLYEDDKGKKLLQKECAQIRQACFCKYSKK